MKRVLFKLNLKVILRSFIFYLFLIFTLFGYAFFAINIYMIRHYTNFLYFFNGLEYMDAVMYVLLFCMAVFFAQQKCLLENCCFVPEHKTVTAKFCAVLILSSVICILPVLFMLVFSLTQNVGAFYTFFSMLYAVIRWIITILISVSVGFLTGFVTKSVFAYLFSIPFTFISTFLNKRILFMIFKTDYDNLYKFSHLFSVNRPFTDGQPVEYRGPELDTLLLCKLLLAIVICLAVFFILKLLLNKNLKLPYAAGTAVSIGAVAAFSILYLNLHPVRYENPQKLYVTDYKSQPFEITSISGDIKLKEFCSYDISLAVSPKAKAGAITLMLDESLKVESIKIENKPVNFERKGDFITFDCPYDDFEVDISAGGRISYVSSINSMDIYTSALSCALPPDFAFLPKVLGDDSKKQYELNVKSSNTLISNLDTVKKDGLYKLTGNASEACFFTGFLTQSTLGDVTLYHAKYNVITDYQKLYSSIINERSMVFDHVTNQVIKAKMRQAPKVFLIHYMYGTGGFGVPYDNFIMINYGNISQPVKGEGR